jgi:hypothetical protein
MKAKHPELVVVVVVVVVAARQGKSSCRGGRKHEIETVRHMWTATWAGYEHVYGAHFSTGIYT